MNQDKRNPGLAVVFSFIFSGLGQLYNGELTKGLVIIFISGLNMLVLVIGSILVGYWLLGRAQYGNLLVFGLALFFAGLISICLTGIYSIFDAYRAAGKK